MVSGYYIFDTYSFKSDYKITFILWEKINRHTIQQ